MGEIMLHRHSFIFLFLTIFSLLCAGESNYAIATGEEDRDRLHVLSAIYDDYSNQWLDQCAIQPGDRVLEIGCGIGLMSQDIARKVGSEGSILATDLSEDQLKVARANLKDRNISNLKFQQLSAYELDKLDEKFDVVYVRFLLVHVPEPIKIIEQVKGVLKPGGRFIIEDLTGNDTFYSQPSHQGMVILQYLDKLQFEIQASDDKYFQELPNLLVNSGFTNVQEKRSHPKLDTPIKRMMLHQNLTSLKDSLLHSEKLSQKEYDEMFPKVMELERASHIDVYSYELGQICATLPE